MAYFTIDQYFTAQDANEIKQLWIATSRPEGIEVGEIWLHDTTPKMLKRYMGSDQDEIIAIAEDGVLRKDIDDTFTGNLTGQSTGENIAVYLERTDGAKGCFYAGQYRVFIGSQSEHELRFLVNDIVKMLIDTSGNVGIGTTTPAAKLDVAGDVYAEGEVNSGIASISLDDTQIQSLNISNSVPCTIVLKNSEGGAANGAKFEVGSDLNISNGCRFNYGNSTYWSETKDTAGKVNVYADTDDTIKIQNKRGQTVTITYGVFGLGIG